MENLKESAVALLFDRVMDDARQSRNAGQFTTCASNTPVSICPCRLTCTNNR